MDDENLSEHGRAPCLLVCCSTTPSLAVIPDHYSRLTRQQRARGRRLRNLGGGPGIAASDADAVLRDVGIAARHDQLEMVRAAEPQ